MSNRGRPRKDGSKNKMFSWRLTEGELGRLRFLSIITGKSKSQILSDALDIYYKMLVKND